MTYAHLIAFLLLLGMWYVGEHMDCANCIIPVSDNSTMVCDGDGGFGHSKIRGRPDCHAVEGGLGNRRNVNQ